jgi:hypothetical protein
MADQREDRHPASSAVLRFAVMGLFGIVARSSMDIAVIGDLPKQRLPRTYYAMMHRRHEDPILFLPTLMRRLGRRALAGDVQFGLRSDAFGPGFLARMASGPAILSRALQPLAIGDILRLLGAHPLSDMVRPLDVTLLLAMEIAGDPRVEAVCTGPFAVELARRMKLTVEQVMRLPLSAVERWARSRAADWSTGPEIFVDPLRRQMERELVVRVRRDAMELASWLQQGGSIFSAPEGGLSPLGYPLPVSGGFHRLMTLSPADTTIVPIALIYDWMTTRRLRLLVGIAPAIASAPALARHELATALRSAWLSVAPIGCSQLASDILLRARESVTGLTWSEIEEILGEAAAALATVRQAVDPILLRPSSLARRLRSYRDFLLQRRMLRSDRHGCWMLASLGQPFLPAADQTAYDRDPVRYAQRELHAIFAADPATESAYFDILRAHRLAEPGVQQQIG